MSRRVYGKPLERVVPVGEPFSRHDGHRVGTGRKTEKTLTAAVREARVAEAGARDALAECRGLVADGCGRLAACRRAVCVCCWMAGVCVVMVVLLVALWAVLALRL